MRKSSWASPPLSFFLQLDTYDLMLNSGVLGIEKCTELICTIFD